MKIPTTLAALPVAMFLPACGRPRKNRWSTARRPPPPTLPTHRFAVHPLPNPWQSREAMKVGYRVIAMASDAADFKGIFIVRKDSGIKTKLCQVRA